MATEAVLWNESDWAPVTVALPATVTGDIRREQIEVDDSTTTGADHPADYRPKIGPPPWWVPGQQ